MGGNGTAPLAAAKITRSVASAEAIGQLYPKARESVVDSLRHAVECGKALAAKKQSMPHGHWLKWLESNEDTLGFGKRAAQRLMDWASNTSLATHFDETTATAALKGLWGHQGRPALYSSKSGEWASPPAIVSRVELR